MSPLVLILASLLFSNSYLVDAQKYSKSEYSKVLDLTTRFYGAQRCGGSELGVNWLLKNNPEGNDCHYYDGPSYRPQVDLNGGWHDAGDHIKFTLTIAWSAYALLKSYDAFPNSHKDLDDENFSGNPNGIPDILDQVKTATDYLMKCHIDSSTFIKRVGGDQDHSNFYTSPKQTKLSVAEGGGERPVMNEAKGDIAGISAAALALMAIHYKKYSSSYSSSCLSKAESIYRYGSSRPSGTDDSFYPSETWMDDFFCGAIELFRATQNQTYFETAQSYEERIGQHYWVVDWDYHQDYCRHSAVLANLPGASDRWRLDVDSYLGTISSSQYINGLAYFSDWGSLRYATNAAYSVALYYSAVSQSEKYKTFAISQIDYVMGINEYQRSFIVGYGVNPPKKPHHANSYGYENWPDSSNNFKYPLLGAVVGGPNLIVPGYKDDPNDYVSNEVTIDYNIGTVGLSAFLVSIL